MPYLKGSEPQATWGFSPERRCLELFVVALNALTMDRRFQPRRAPNGDRTLIHSDRPTTNYGGLVRSLPGAEEYS